MTPSSVQPPTPDATPNRRNASAAIPPTYGPFDPTLLAKVSKEGMCVDLAERAETDELAAAAVRLLQLWSFVPSEYEHSIPHAKVRPLGPFSDLVAERLGRLSDQARRGKVSPMQVYAVLESAALGVGKKTISKLIDNPGSYEFHVARLDLVIAERAIAVAFGQSDPESGPLTWRAIRAESRIAKYAQALADVEGSHPLLAWSDIGSRHPILDPRPFLRKGRSQDQEIYMYRVQHAIDHGFRAMVVAMLDRNEITNETVEVALITAECIMRLMGHLSRVRDSGEFDRLDPFLMENGEVTGHGTGAFSVWVMLASYLFLGSEKSKADLVRDANFRAFDSDAADLVAKVVDGTLSPFGSGMVMNTAVQAKLRRFTRGFQASHMEAVKKHAPASMDVPAPANMAITNRESMEAVVKG